jgi:thiol-disulfide isomerase/thioredoxin
MRAPLAAIACAAVVALAGCATPDSLVQSVPGENYVSSDGALTEVAPENRGEPIEFNEVTSDGTAISNGDYLGSVMVVNFWYASCPPCRVEAPELAEYANSAPDGVEFLGVNVYDGAAAAESFENTYGIPYPSVLDSSTGSMRLAFAGELPPSGVPVTLLVDKQGRVAGRYSGAILDFSILSDMVDRVLAE